MEERLFTELTSTEFKIFVFIEYWRGDSGFKHNLIPTTEYMYDKLNISTRTITRAIKGLRDKGVIK